MRVDVLSSAPDLVLPFLCLQQSQILGRYRAAPDALADPTVPADVLAYPVIAVPALLEVGWDFADSSGRTRSFASELVLWSRKLSAAETIP